MTDDTMPLEKGVSERPNSPHLWWHIKVPKDLKALYEGQQWAEQISLGTADRREANLKAVRLRAQWLSDDNAFVESLFRTAKYRPEFPSRGFVDLQDARQWAANFVHWYNHEHRHSGIRYVSPAQRHAGLDHDILAEREVVYQQARERHPRRWARGTRNWSPIEFVTLNPERERAVRAGAAPEVHIDQMAA